MKIGFPMGTLQQVNSKLMVAHRFLRLRVDVLVEALLAAGFKHGKGSLEEIWVQFRNEKFSYFCFKCGRLTHLMGHCSQVNFEQILLANGRCSCMFEPWLHVEKKLMAPFALQTTSSKAIGVSVADEFDFQATSRKQLVVREEKGKGTCFDGDIADQGRFTTVGDADKISNVRLLMK